jgi:hypothetical protein
MRRSGTATVLGAGASVPSAQPTKQEHIGDGQHIPMRVLFVCTHDSARSQMAETSRLDGTRRIPFAENGGR